MLEQYNVTSEELCHYGVIGMKWGVRRNPSKAYAKAVRKKHKIDAKSAKLGVKGAKMQLEATKKMSKATSMSTMKDGLKAQAKANKKTLKSEKLQKKGVKWSKKMDQTFASYSITRIPNGNVTSGKNFVYRHMYGNDSYEVAKVDDIT